SRTRESASAWARALRSSSVSVRRTTPDFGLGVVSACAGVRLGVGAPAPATLPAGFLGSGAGGASAFVSPPTARRLTFSTTTCLLRPWLKLWGTVSVSERGWSVSVLPETLSFFSPGFFVSLIPYCVLVRRPSAHAR